MARAPCGSSLRSHHHHRTKTRDRDHTRRRALLGLLDGIRLLTWPIPSGSSGSLSASEAFGRLCTKLSRLCVPARPILSKAS